MGERDDKAAAAIDNLGLADILIPIWRQKLLVIAVCGVVTVAACLYAFMSKPVYEAKAYLLPPAASEIAELNFSRSLDPKLSVIAVKDVYDAFIRNLQADAFRRAFYKDVYLVSPPQGEVNSSASSYADFSKNVVVGNPLADSPTRYSVSVFGTDPAIAADTLAKLIERAKVATTQEIIKNIKTEADARAKGLEQQIGFLRDGAVTSRRDAIKRLQEALSVAESIGLEQPPIIMSGVPTGITREGQPYLVGPMDGPYVYMRGAKALRAEIKILTDRGSDDPFISGLRNLEEQLAYVKSIELDVAAVNVSRQDGVIEAPTAPVKPRKSLIIGLGVVMGLLLGVISAFTRYFLKGAVRSRN
jgi:chain length determinant protein (polysaccharide antigen chain regulator)